MLHIVLLLALLSCLSCSKDPPSSCSAQPSAMVRVLTIEAGTATHDRTARLAEVEGMLGDAAEQAGCIDIVVLPELFAFLHTREHGASDFHGAPHSGAEDAEGGETSEACRQWARTWKCYVVCPFAELGDPSASGPQQNGRPVYNTAMLVDREGIEVGRYRKSFPAYGTEFEEGFTPSPPVFSLPVWSTDFGLVSTLICFDLHFAELWQELELAGAELVVWPSATGGTTLAQAYATIHHYAVVQQPAGVFISPSGDLIPPSYTSPDKRVKIFASSLAAKHRAAGRAKQQGNAGPPVDGAAAEATCVVGHSVACDAADDVRTDSKCRLCTAGGRVVRREARDRLGKLRRCSEPQDVVVDSGSQASRWYQGGRALWESLWQHLEVPQGVGLPQGQARASAGRSHEM
uniref:CN hydrolase domain-containing protein n=1 Tax=Hemiselmis andersenii TaxID=464988 RepID=A0A7S1MXM4_HEMAN|mmetsp:Transcript_32701/g.76371  ORF Transcript_32701/g.76371 Transcript_32701/m.76371 type:complete len:404 (+) Transcript_32701:34-1245(+)